MAASQEDEWKWMIDQDPHSGSIAGDSGHGMMTVTKETESMEAAEYLSDVEWREDNPLFVFDDDNVTKPQTPTAALIPIQTCEEDSFHSI